MHWIDFLTIFFLGIGIFKKNCFLKGGVNLNPIFPPLDMVLMEISRSHFKQSINSMLIP